MKNFVLFIFSVLLAISAQAQNQNRCQCGFKDWQGDCTANVEYQGSSLKITSNTEQCSRVDWLANGNPQVSIVTDGIKREQWLGSGKPQISVDSCKVCKDSFVGGANSSLEVKNLAGARTQKLNNEQLSAAAKKCGSFSPDWLQSHCQCPMETKTIGQITTTNPDRGCTNRCMEEKILPGWYYGTISCPP